MDRPELLGTALFDLTGRSALITGAGRGLGRTMALALAAAGANLAVVSRSETELESVCAEIAPMGRLAVGVRCDVTNEADCIRAVEVTLDRLGRLDILVNNAGINLRKPVLDLQPSEFEQVLRTNLIGYLLMAKAAGRQLVQQRSGKVINMSSILGRVGLAGQAAYASSKGGIEQLTKVLAIEWADSNVQVNAIGPTYFETELTRPLFEDPERNRFITERTPLKRWGQPHELAGSVIFLASRASDYVTGHTLMVDGGWTAW